MGFLSKLFYSEVISIKAGKAASAKGKHPTKMLTDISEICQDARLDRGEIYFAGDGKLNFSSSIPEAIHQTLRNVINEHL